MPPSELVRRLVVRFDYRLVPLPFGDAFRLTALHRAAPPGSGETIRKEHIVDATIPAYAYEVSPIVPPQSIRNPRSQSASDYELANEPSHGRQSA